MGINTMLVTSPNEVLVATRLHWQVNVTCLPSYVYDLKGSNDKNWVNADGSTRRHTERVLLFPAGSPWLIDLHPILMSHLIASRNFTFFFIGLFPAKALRKNLG